MQETQAKINKLREIVAQIDKIMKLDIMPQEGMQYQVEKEQIKLQILRLELDLIR